MANKRMSQDLNPDCLAAQSIKMELESSSFDSQTSNSVDMPFCQKFYICAPLKKTNKPYCVLRIVEAALKTFPCSGDFSVSLVALTEINTFELCRGQMSLLSHYLTPDPESHRRCMVETNDIQCSSKSSLPHTPISATSLAVGKSSQGELIYLLQVSLPFLPVFSKADGRSAKAEDQRGEQG